jgi:G3E family GTPase
MSKARYIMVGGFLGAGKTTAIIKLAEQLQSEGHKVGLITNDQSIGLVDTAMAAAHDFPVEEITGGCFCCRFNSLLDASRNLTRDVQPDIFLAEPVGSCTDLKATVSFPLRQMYGDDFAIAPLSVLVDPIRAMRILGLTPGKNFSEKVSYIYLKQLEEAEIIVINKSDLLTQEQLDGLTDALKKRFPMARVLHASARQGTNLDSWLQLIRSSELAPGESMEVDYDTYAAGEALLGWMNCAATLSSGAEFDGNAFLKRLAMDLQARLKSAAAEVAHLKMTLSPAEGNDLAVLNLVRNDYQPELSHKLAEPVAEGELLVNLRAEIAPEFLREATRETLAAVARDAGVKVEIDQLEAFRPGRPTPTHRLARV